MEEIHFFFKGGSLTVKKRICILQNCAETVSALEGLGFTALTVTPAVGLDSEISAHADMLVHICPDGTVFVHDSQTALTEKLLSLGCNAVPVSHRFGAYPADVALNAAASGAFAAGRKDAVHPLILEKYGEAFLDVRQGYAKCSSCFAGERAVITEDCGIARAFEEKGFDTLLIEKGDVYLSEKHYGFFGGATGSPDEKTLLINGELSYHRDAEKIRAFLNRHGVSPVELKKGKITDIGSILSVKGK